MEIITGGLTHKEQDVLKELMEKFFNDREKKPASWDNIEIIEYNKAIGKNKV